MNPTHARAGEIDRYLDGVRTALADLPADVRDELLEDLPAHLAEVATESGEPLERRLGGPARYAAELRAAAGYERSVSGSRQVPLQLRAALRQVDLAGGRLLGYDRFVEFLVALRPAWWVLRGYVAGMLVVALWLDESSGAVPRLDRSVLITVPVLAVAIVVSVRLGRIRVPRPGRLMLYAVNVAAALLLLGGAAAQAGSVPSVSGPGYSSPYDTVTDVFPYDSNGNPLSGVVLYDQNGSPLHFGDPERCATNGAPPDWTDTYRYPLCPLGPGARRGPTPSPTVPGSPAPSVSGSPSPSPAK